MHPYIPIYFFLFSGLGLILYHITRLLQHRKNRERRIRSLLLSVLPLCFASVVTFGFLYEVTIHNAVEVPLSPTATDEREQEMWYMLRPGCYSSAIVFSPESKPIWGEEANFCLEYSVQINGQVVDEESGLKRVDLRNRPQVLLSHCILVRTRHDLVHIVLRIKPSKKGEQLPPMRFVVQTQDELRMYTQGGYSITDYPSPVSQE